MIVWDVAPGRTLGPAPHLVMGILNVTPDSFSDGGRFLDPAAAVAHGLRLADEGAHIIDLGGESSRPGSRPVPADEEWARLEPVLAGLVPALAARTAPALSVDTWRAETARKALDAGVAIVNDISAARFDPAMVDLLAERRPGYVLMHALDRPATMQQAPRYDDVVAEVLAFFEERLAVLVKAGLPESRVALDPGIGFGKTAAHNLRLLACLDRLLALGRPVLVGLSRKRFLGSVLGDETLDRGGATQAAQAMAAQRGARLHRVHDVAATLQTLAVVQAIESAACTT